MKTINFEELWIGDRFKLSDESIWTKIGVDTARGHSKESIKLKDRGYGYIGDSICSFELTDKIEFIPV